MTDEIGLIASITPEIDGADDAREQIERQIGGSVSVGVDVDDRKIQQARKRMQVRQGGGDFGPRERVRHGGSPNQGSMDRDRVQRFQKLLQRRKQSETPSALDKAKSAAGTAGGVAKSGAKTAGHIYGAKMLRKMGVPTTVPSTNLMGTSDDQPTFGDKVRDSVFGGGGGSTSAEPSTNATVNGSTATESEETVPLLQDQLEVQEEILEIMEADDAGVSPGGGGGGGGGMGKFAALLKMLGTGTAVAGGTALLAHQRRKGNNMANESYKDTLDDPPDGRQPWHRRGNFEPGQMPVPSQETIDDTINVVSDLGEDFYDRLVRGGTSNGNRGPQSDREERAKDRTESDPESTTDSTRGEKARTWAEDSTSGGSPTMSKREAAQHLTEGRHGNQSFADSGPPGTSQPGGGGSSGGSGASGQTENKAKNTERQSGETKVVINNEFTVDPSKLEQTKREVSRTIDKKVNELENKMSGGSGSGSGRFVR